MRRRAIAGRIVPLAEPPTAVDPARRIELGVRPEYVRFAGPDQSHAVPVDVVRVADAGRRRIVETRAGEDRIFLLADEDEAIPDGAAQIAFAREGARVYADGWLAHAETGA